MEIDRRTFLALCAGVIAAPASAAAIDGPLFLGARASSGRNEVAVIDAEGRDRLVLPLEARGHSFALDASRRRAVAFARAPGRFGVAFSLDGRTQPQAFAAQPGRHFFGHGIFSSDSRLMLASENDYEAGQGVLGIYDATDGFRRIGETPSGGVGPHDIVPLPDGRTACIANGGILTHPDYDGVKLNLDTMAPALTYVDIATGDIVESVSLPPELHRLSIRHLAVDAFGVVWFGCQYEGEKRDRPPLVGRHRRGRAPELFAGPPATLRALDNYVGSVSVDASGTVVATSSPLGGLVVFWDAATGTYLGERALADGCGIAPLGERVVLASSGRGVLERLGPDIESPSLGPAGGPAWDNHLLRMT